MELERILRGLPRTRQGVRESWGVAPASGKEEERRGARSTGARRGMRARRERYGVRQREGPGAGETESGQDELKLDKGRHLVNPAEKYWWTVGKKGKGYHGNTLQKARAM